MHVVAEVRRDEDVARSAMITEVARQLAVRAFVRRTVERRVLHVREVDKRIVLRGIKSRAPQGTVRATDVLLVRLPRNVSLIEESDEMSFRMNHVHSRISVVGHSEVRTGFQPQVIGQAGVIIGWIVVLLGMRARRQQHVIDVRRGRAALDVRPVMILHDNDEHRLQGVMRVRRDVGLMRRSCRIVVNGLRLKRSTGSEHGSQCQCRNWSEARQLRFYDVTS